MAISVIPEILCSSHFLEHQIASGAENLRMAAEVDEESAHSSLNPTLLDCIRHCPYLMFSTIVASFGGILFGFDTAALNGILIMPSFIMAMGGEHLSATGWADRSSWITSSLLLGAAFSSPFTAIVADSVGRKVCINVSSLIIFIGACLQTFAQSWVLMVIGRLIVGGGIGMLSTAVPLYLAEVSPQSIRGAISSLFELTVACGILIAFIVNWGFNGTSISLPFGDQSSNSNSNSDSNWRYILGIQAAMALCLSAMMIPLPESPRWLITIGNEDMARATLKRIRRCVVIGRRKTDAGEWLDVTNIDHECDEMRSDFDMNRRKETAWYDFSVLLQPAMLLRTGIAISIKVLQQLTGINSIMYYSSIIFSSIGIDPDTTTVVTGLVNVTATFLSILLIDRWGRRPLLIWGSVGMCVSSLGVGGIVLSTDASEPVAATFIAILICFFIVNFAYSYGPIAWLYPAEIFPMHARAKGVSVSTSADWLANFAVSKCVPIMILPGSAVGGLGGTFLTFAGWTFFMTIWAITHIHETAHLSLEDADKAFSVSSIAQYKQYIISNTSYFFYFGEMSMFAYTSSMHCKPSLIGQSDEIDEMAASITSNPLVHVPLASSLKHDV